MNGCFFRPHRPQDFPRQLSFVHETEESANIALGLDVTTPLVQDIHQCLTGDVLTIHSLRFLKNSAFSKQERFLPMSRSLSSGFSQYGSGQRICWGETSFVWTLTKRYRPKQAVQ
jgi:hypothetical protein